MDDIFKIHLVETEMGRLNISTTIMSPKAAGKLPEPVPVLPLSSPGDTAIVTVTVEELPPPPETLPLPDTMPNPPTTNQPSDPTPKFTLFPLLPPELRLKIWLFSFLLPPTRVVELHTRRTHYADRVDEHSSAPQWQSDSRNPPALSVNAEARCAALEFYNVRLPLAYAPVQHHQGQGQYGGGGGRGMMWVDGGLEWVYGSGNGGGGAGGGASPSYGYGGGGAGVGANATWKQKVIRERPGDLLQHRDRCLYIDLEVDTVVLLGDLHFGRLSRLLNWFRGNDDGGRKLPRDKGDGAGKEGKGLRRLAMSVAPWSHQVGAATLKAFARTVFADVEEFVLFMYTDRMPPEGWDGSEIVLEECTKDDSYRRFVMGRGSQFRDGDGWMVVGKSPMKIADIRFVDGG